jgi:hypothetical protein
MDDGRFLVDVFMFAGGSDDAFALSGAMAVIQDFKS